MRIPSLNIKIFFPRTFMATHWIWPGNKHDPMSSSTYERGETAIYEYPGKFQNFNYFYFNSHKLPQFGNINNKREELYSSEHVLSIGISILVRDFTSYAVENYENYAAKIGGSCHMRYLTVNPTNGRIQKPTLMCVQIFNWLCE